MGRYKLKKAKYRLDSLNVCGSKVAITYVVNMHVIE